MRLRCFVLLLFAAGPLPAPPRIPSADEALLDRGVQLVEKGKFESGRLALQTLIHSYPQSRLAEGARDTIEASLLFEEAQARIKSRRYGTAEVTLQTLLAVYPEGVLAEQARQAIRVARLQDPEEKGPIVRSIRFENVGGATAEEILGSLRQREIGLEIERPYRKEEVMRAKEALRELLEARGQRGALVKAEVRDCAPHAVEVLFTAGR